MVSVIQTLAVLVSYMFFRFRFIQSRRFYIGVIQTFVIEILLTPFRFRPWPSLADHRYSIRHWFYSLEACDIGVIQ